jgi:hypothetical protein
MANIKIILIVDTQKIKKGNVETHCNFTDNTKDMKILDPKEYITVIDAGQTIEWSGVARNPETCDCVSIDSIVLEHKHGNIDLFGTPVIIGSGGTLRATILPHETGGRNETYKVYFTVIRNKDGYTETYTIDPKIGINP